MVLVGVDYVDEVNICPIHGEEVVSGGKCLSCLYFDTTSGASNSNSATGTTNEVRRILDVDNLETIVCDTRLVSLQGELSSILGIRVPGVRGRVPVKYKITLSRAFDVVADDDPAIDTIELYYPKNTSPEVRKKCKPHKRAIEDVVRKAFYGEE